MQPGVAVEGVEDDGGGEVKPATCKCGKPVPPDLAYYRVCGDCWNEIVTGCDYKVALAQTKARMEGDEELRRRGR